MPSLGLSAGEKKARLRGEIGVASKEEDVGGKEAGGKEAGGGQTPSPADKARTNTENAKKAAEVRRKVLEAKMKKEEVGKGGKK